MTLESHSIVVPCRTIDRQWDNRSDPYPGHIVATYQMNESVGYMSRNSFRTPAFALKRATGRLPQNDFGYQEYLVTDLMGYTESWSRNFFGYEPHARTEGRVAPFNGSVPSFLSIASSMEALVRAKLMDQLRDSDIDLGTFVGEFRETAEMFLAFSHALVAAVKAARKRDLLGVARALGMKPESTKDFANAWLMVKYGLQPFISDILGAAKALQKGMLEERFFMIHAGDVFDDSLVTTSGSVNSSGGLVTTTWNYKVQVGGRLKYSVSNAKVATLSSLGLLNPLAVGWELTKLSFVFDWAIGIGSWLGQLDVTFGKSFDSGSITTFIRKQGSQTWDRHWVSATGDYGGNSRAVGSLTDLKVTRVSMLTWPINFVPAFKDPRSLNHVITGLSLLRQRW